MDEADRILNMDFEAELDKILKVIPKERNTYLYSATMTKKVKTLFIDIPNWRAPSFSSKGRSLIVYIVITHSEWRWCYATLAWQLSPYMDRCHR